MKTFREIVEVGYGKRAVIGDEIEVNKKVYTIYDVGFNLRGRGPTEYIIYYRDSKSMGNMSSLKVEWISDTRLKYIGKQ